MHNFLFLQNLQDSAEQKPKLKKNRSLPGCPWNKKQNKNWRKQNKTKVDKIPPLPGCPWGLSSNSGNGERPRSKIAAIVNHFIHLHRFRNRCNKSAHLFCKLTNSSFSSCLISSCFESPEKLLKTTDYEVALRQPGVCFHSIELSTTIVETRLRLGTAGVQTI